jgi:hypothetical protein
MRRWIWIVGGGVALLFLIAAISAIRAVSESGGSVQLSERASTTAVSAPSNATPLKDKRLVGHWIGYGNPAAGMIVTAQPILDVAPEGNYLIVYQNSDLPVERGAIEADNGKWKMTATEGTRRDEGSYQFSNEMNLVMTGKEGQLNWMRVASESKQAKLKASGLDPRNAKITQLAAIAREAAKKWRPDAALVFIQTMNPQNSGAINLLTAGMFTQFTFYSPSADTGALVFVSTFGEPTLSATGVKMSPYTKAIPEKFLDLADAMIEARKDGYRQHIVRAELHFFAKHNREYRFAWVIMGDGQIDDGDNTYCIDATTKETFCQADILDDVTNAREGPSRPDGHWLREGLQYSATFTAHNEIIWQMLTLQIKPPGAAKAMEVEVPIRPYSDDDRERFLPMKPDGSWSMQQVSSGAGPQHTPTGEERRIFRKVYGDALLPIEVPPYFVVCRALSKQSKSSREAMQHEVEQLYDDPNWGSELQSAEAREQQQQREQPAQSRPRVRM